MKEYLDHFEWQTQTNPAHPAIKDGSQIVSYSTLAAWTDAVATQIIAQRLDPTKPIAYLGSQGINLIVAFLASQKAGYPFLPINRSFTPEIVSKLLAISSSSICITDQENVFKDELLSVQTLALAPQPTDQIPKFQCVLMDERATALLHCSSGSTGDPKVIPHSRMALQGYINIHRDEYRLTQEDVVAHTNNFWLESVMAIFSVGATLSCLEPSNGHLKSIIERILSDKVSVLPLYPALLRTFYGVGVCLPTLRLVMVSGEAITKSDVKIFEAITSTGSILLNSYASQEAVWVTSYRHRNGELMQAQSLPLGKPVDPMEVQILSKDGFFQPVGEIGEITMKSRLLPPSYLGGCSDGPPQFYQDQNGIPNYASQDLGYFDSDGNLHYVSRKDDQIKIRGHLVDINEVEKIISKLFEFEEVSISSYLAPNNSKQLICYYISKEAIATKSIIRKLRAKLPNYMIPSFFYKLENLPKTPSGKINQQQLQNISLKSGYSLAEHTESTCERDVKEIMAEVLGYSDFSRHDNFFDIGGDSLSALNMIFKIETKFGIRIPRDLFVQGASVGDIASSIEQEKYNAELVTITPLNYSKSDLVFFAIPTLKNELNHYSTLGEALRPVGSLLGLRVSELRYLTLTGRNPLDKLSHSASTKITEYLDGKEINLVGYSAAGILACKIAIKLNTLGYNINSVFLFDSECDGYKKIRLSFLPHYIGWSIENISWTLRKISRWVRRKDKAEIRRSFPEYMFNAHLYAELTDWSPEPIKANKVIFFKPQDGSVDDTQIEKWQRTAKGRFVVIPTRGDHVSIEEFDVAFYVAQVLSGKLGAQKTLDSISKSSEIKHDS